MQNNNNNNINDNHISELQPHNSIGEMGSTSLINPQDQ